MRKIKPLENGLEKYNIHCWASGVRSSQTENRKEMKFLDVIRQRLSLRPLLNWTNKDIFYYMKENNLPAHPLFSKGYSTVGDWHSSTPDGIKKKAEIQDLEELNKNVEYTLIIKLIIKKWSQI